jgi:4-amino-4-deoxychorismate lyase
VIWVDGELSSQLPLPDRGLYFGDGLFETLLYWQGKCLFVDLHWQRLQRGLDLLDFPDCLPSIRHQLERVEEACRREGPGRRALRITVTRGTGPRGYAPPAEPQPRIVISAAPPEAETLEMAAPASLCLAGIRWSRQPQLAGLKHLNRLEQVLAAAEAARAGCDEALMLDQSEGVLSVAAGNLFLVSGGQLLTPCLDQCGIAGTRRRLILERWAPAIGLQVVEQRLDLARLQRAEEVFYSNSLQGLRPVGRLGEARWQTHKVCQALYDCYREAAA